MESLIDKLSSQAILWVPKVLGVIVIFLLFFIGAKIMKKIVISAAERFKLDNNITSLLARTVSIGLMIFGFVTAMGTVGINVSAIVAGLGLTGFALGFALKDTISNLLSGVLILLYKPFEKGSLIQIAGFQGVVISIDLRYTELESEGNKVLIPNSNLFTNPITVINQTEV